MYGKCKDCRKNLSCHKPTGYMFGFCETDFEPKSEPKENMQSAATNAGMQWKQLSSTIWEAEGKYGKFRIERSGGKFWARYGSEDFSFKMPPKSKLSEAKAVCEENEYWEAAV